MIPPAQAAMVFCNRTQGAIEAALGYRDVDGWLSEGWWKIQPGQCARVLGGTLNQRFYFYYARALTTRDRNKPPYIWSGKYHFCTNIKAFRIEGDVKCEDKGYKTKDFQQIDLGGPVRDYTLDFKDENDRE